MNKMKKISALLACVALMNMSSAFANSPAKIGPALEEKAVTFTVDYQKMQHPSLLNTRGEIIAVEGNKVIIKGEGHFKMLAAIVGEGTYIVNGKNGKEKKASALKKGREVTVYYTAKATRSLPPQTAAIAIVIGEADEKIGNYFVVDQVIPNEDGTSVKVLNSNNDLIATVDAEACEEFNKIKAGDNLLVWYNMMTMSLPGQTHATKAVILPAKA